jgi:uncharacterized membrane protein
MQELLSYISDPLIGVLVLLCILSFLVGISAWTLSIFYNEVGQKKGRYLDGSKRDFLEEELGLHTTLFSKVSFLIFFILGVGLVIFYFVKGTPMQAHILEWLNLLIRWIHVIFGILWIGASFYFIFLENSLNRTDNVRDELAGDLWAVHGGGFYYLEKFKLAPEKLPKVLHWFKYEAYFTWITGFLLLIVVYYMNANLYLVDKSVMDIPESHAVLISVSSLIIGWFIYDRLCKTRLVDNGPLFGLVGFIISVAFAWGYSQVFSPRAAYIHVGALLGTLMAGNVFYGIIPAQKELVAAAKEKRPIDPSLGKNAGRRSLHNNYITFPVLFIMISNHFPSTFGHTYNWLVLAGIAAASVIVRHYLNMHEQGKNLSYLLPVAMFTIIGLVIYTGPKIGSIKSYDGKEVEQIGFGEARKIINTHCLGCHSKFPTDDQYKIAPKNQVFDTPEDIINAKDLIKKQSVDSKIMPMGNKTDMTDEERQRLGMWIDQGAKLE